MRIIPDGDGYNDLRPQPSLGYDSASEDPLTKQKLILLPIIFIVLGPTSGCSTSEKSSTSNQSNVSSPSSPTKVNGQPTTTRGNSCPPCQPDLVSYLSFTSL